MLRITTYNNSWSITFRLEGKLAGQWVQELERCWRAALDAADRKSILVELTGVTFIDQDGKNLLGLMHRHGAEFLAVGCLNKFIVEEIIRTQVEPDEGPIGGLREQSA